MGQTRVAHTFTKVMPEIVVTNGPELLLLKGLENDRSFWWPPGAYWLNSGTCDLRVEDPRSWIERTLLTQLRVRLSALELRAVSFINEAHSPVLVYAVSISGAPLPNDDLGFTQARFFGKSQMPQHLGRDENHGNWLRETVDKWIFQSADLPRWSA